MVFKKEYQELIGMNRSRRKMHEKRERDRKSLRRLL